MRPTGQHLVDIALSHLGLPYWNRDDTRFGPWHMDCSGFMVRVIREAGIYVPGNAENSEGLDLWGRNSGLEIPLSEAYKTPGALVSVWGLGNKGHVGMAKGDAITSIETPAYGEWGHGSGTRNITNASGRKWTNACCVPGVDSTGAGEVADLKALHDSIESAVRLTFGYEAPKPVAVTWLQVMLNRAKHPQPPLVVDGVYGPRTLQVLCAWETNAEKFLHLPHNTFPPAGAVDPGVWFLLRKAAKI